MISIVKSSTLNPYNYNTFRCCVFSKKGHQRPNTKCFLKEFLHKFVSNPIILQAVAEPDTLK